MQTVKTVLALRQAIAEYRASAERVAFVPTMGNLHAGHLHLIDVARSKADRVVVSIFVNPIQFGAGEDFEAYPRTLAEDSGLLEERAVDVLYAPGVEEIYPAGCQAVTHVEVPGVSQVLCGAFRPGHFTGVATVVLKLLNQVQPEVAVFGEKDFQQLVVIRRMARDLDVPVEVVGVPTVREDDGLAMSSRNAYLTAGERQVAPGLFRMLEAARARIVGGETDYTRIEGEAMEDLQRAGFRPEYFSVRRASDLDFPQDTDRELVVLTAAWMGRTRLIDNLPVNR